MKNLLLFVLFIIFLLVCSCESSVTGYTDLNDNIQTQVSTENNPEEIDAGKPIVSQNINIKGLESLPLAKQQTETTTSGSYTILNLSVSGVNHPILEFQWPDGSVGPACVVEIWRGIFYGISGYKNIVLNEEKIADQSYPFGFQSGSGVYHDYSVTEPGHYIAPGVFQGTAYKVRARFIDGTYTIFSIYRVW